MLAKPTGALVIPTAANAIGWNRGLMMPRRKLSRHKDCQARVAAQRRSE
jgi:hypothetical protein